MKTLLREMKTLFGKVFWVIFYVWAGSAISLAILVGLGIIR